METKMASRSAIALVMGIMFIATAAHGKLRKWNKNMQELAKVFAEVLPETASSRPITAAGTKKLERGAKKILDLAHKVNMGPGTKGNPLPPEADPTIGFVSGLFEREMKHAYASLQAGRVEYARGVLRSVSGYCIACHTRHDRGPDFPTIELPPHSESLSAMERAELLAATRQFDKALDEFEAIAGNAKTAQSRQLEWGRAVRHAFTIAIRVKKDPDRATVVMNKVLALPRVPGFYQENIEGWKESIAQWKAEPAKTTNTEEGLFLEAVRLTEAGKAKQKYPLDHSADVLYLRASLAAHELLTLYPGGARMSEAFLIAGNAYDLLEDRLVSPLPDMYYEACIRNSPHSAIAEQCYRRYEQNVYFGWSGSAGTSIPKDVQAIMDELGKLAAVNQK